MTDPIRAAAQALLAAWDTHRSIGDLADRMWDLRAALSAQQPAPTNAEIQDCTDFVRGDTEFRDAVQQGSDGGGAIYWYDEASGYWKGDAPDPTAAPATPQPEAVTKTAVAGLELFARASNLKHIRCDGCKADFDATPLTSDAQELARQARAAGWVGPMTREGRDLCPKCAAPQPAADERVAEHMRLVSDVITASKALERAKSDAHVHWLSCAEDAVESSARALLAAGLEDAVVTEAMITAYLEANDAYWIATDEIPRPPGKWRTGTPREATRVSLTAAFAAIQKGAP